MIICFLHQVMGTKGHLQNQAIAHAVRWFAALVLGCTLNLST